MNGAINDLDLVLPVYNPHPGWERALADHFNEARRFLGHEKVGLIVVNDGSPRNVDKRSREILEAAVPGMAFVSYEVNRGKGYAVRAGVRESRAPFTIYTDADFPFGIESVARIYRRLRRGHDVVAGVRTLAYFRHLPWKRKAISLATRFMNRTLLGLPIYDTQAGLKGFNGRGREIFLSTTIDSYLFDTEFMRLAQLDANLRVTSVPVKPREGIHFTGMGGTVLKRELGHFLKLFLSGRKK
jgi:glycosyltransferase involved in cell wall biosynthesis